MKRLLDDPQLPARLRADLLRSRAAARALAAGAGLPPLPEALAERAAQPHRPDLVKGWQRPLARWLQPTAKLTTLLLLGSGAAWLTLPGAEAPVARPSSAVERHAAPVAAPAPWPGRLRGDEDVAGAGHGREAVVPEAARSSNVVASMPAPAPAPAPGPGPSARRAPDDGASQAHGQAVAPPARDGAGAASTGSSWRREIGQLVRIRALLERDPVAALRLAHRSSREFPHGVLREERQALSIVALVRNGEKARAANAARAFFARYPHSPMRALIDSALRP